MTIFLWPPEDVGSTAPTCKLQHLHFLTKLLLAPKTLNICGCKTVLLLLLSTAEHCCCCIVFYLYMKFLQLVVERLQV